MKGILNYFILIFIATLFFQCENESSISEEILPEFVTGNICGWQDGFDNNYQNVSANGEIFKIGNVEIFQHGHCWGTEENPDINSEHSELGKVVEVGNFSSHLTEIQSCKTYYVMGYIITNKGVQYGENVVFPTECNNDTGGGGK